MDRNVKQLELLKESFETTSKTLRSLTSILSTQRSITEADFFDWCNFIRNVKFFVNEIEFHLRVLPVTDNMDAILAALKENTAVMLKGLKK